MLKLTQPKYDRLSNVVVAKQFTAMPETSCLDVKVDDGLKATAANKPQRPTTFGYLPAADLALADKKQTGRQQQQQQHCNSTVTEPTCKHTRRRQTAQQVTRTVVLGRVCRAAADRMEHFQHDTTKRATQRWRAALTVHTPACFMHIS